MVGLLSYSPTTPNVRREVGANLNETRDRVARRLLEAALKWAGTTLLVVSCALLVYPGTVLVARGAEWILVP